MSQENRSWVPAVVTGIWPTPRSYVVKAESGTFFRRNRKHLKQPESTSLMAGDEEGVTSATEVATPNKCV